MDGQNIVMYSEYHSLIVMVKRKVIDKELWNMNI